ncbi:chaperone NapD [Oceanithermus sp.]|uniref:chaperone NapD n=1 Tax=Oceanithermus sp. TaxID=2268145 RepID=UPI0025F6C814|nr:chaperone NapD [Oceanithermus sp.]
MNISGLVVRVQPSRIREVREAIEAAGLGEVPADDGENTLVVVVEAEDTAKEMAIYRTIEGIEGVLAVELAYTYSEELEQARDRLEVGDGVPRVLSDDVPPEEVRYGGDVRNWIRRIQDDGKEDPTA